MKHVALISLLLLPTVLYAFTQSRYDEPPRILHPSRLDDPSNLTIIGNVSEKANTLHCTVRNADKVEWVYQRANTGSADDMPAEFIQYETMQDDNGDLSRTISDRDARKTYRSNLNGYYKCIAENRYGYKTETPPIRFILPEIQYRTASVLPVIQGRGNRNAPHKMRCLDETQIVIIPPDLLDWNVVSFYWGIKMKTSDTSYGFDVIEQDSRIKINRRTGDLYFAYLMESDGLVNWVYQCYVTVNNKPGDVIGSRHELSVTSSNDEIPMQLEYPSETNDKKVSCIEKTRCWLTCIYGGRNWETMTDPGTPNWIQPRREESVSITPQDNSVGFTAFEGAEGNWKCMLNNEERLSSVIEVDVRLYPDIVGDEMKNTFIEVGRDVEFICNAKHAIEVKFYVNGNLVTEAFPDYVIYQPRLRSIKIRKLKREHSGMVSCVAFNNIGTKYKSVELNAYTGPNITIEPNDGIVISENISSWTDQDLKFTCTAVLDQKVTAASIHWRTDLPALEGKRLTGHHPDGIRRIVTSAYRGNIIGSFVEFELDTENRDTLANGNWWCVVEMTFRGLGSPIRNSSKAVRFDILQTRTDQVLVAASFEHWWVIGAVVAALFCLLIVVFIICCVKHHKGEEYYVEEKEKKAGHNPEEEMNLYGFSDYKRPATGGYMPMYMSDQDPIKGSRASLDMSEKPLDSDSEGMDEYGDIDPGRFNEDGSFIGQYGKSSTQIDV